MYTTAFLFVDTLETPERGFPVETSFCCCSRAPSVYCVHCFCSWSKLFSNLQRVSAAVDVTELALNLVILVWVDIALEKKKEKKEIAQIEFPIRLRHYPLFFHSYTNSSLILDVHSKNNPTIYWAILILFKCWFIIAYIRKYDRDTKDSADFIISSATISNKISLFITLERSVNSNEENE